MITPSIENGVIVYEDSALVLAVTHGRALIVDEADKAPTYITGWSKNANNIISILGWSPVKITLYICNNPTTKICLKSNHKRNKIKGKRLMEKKR